MEVITVLTNRGIQVLAHEATVLDPTTCTTIKMHPLPWGIKSPGSKTQHATADRVGGPPVGPPDPPIAFT